MNRIVVGALSVIVLAFLAWILWSALAAPPGMYPDSSLERHGRVGDSGARVDSSTADGLAVARAPADSRQALDGSLRVISKATGEGLPALATWTSADPRWDEENPWPLREWDQFLTGASVATAGPDGTLEIRQPSAGPPAPGWIWVTHVGHAAAFVEVSADAHELPLVVELDPAPGVRVEVVDARDRPVAGAVVRTVLDLLPVDRRFSSDARRLAGRYLVRGGITDAEGRLDLPVLDVSQLCWAEHDTRVSAVRHVAPGDRIRLRLEPAVELRGRAIASDSGVDFTGAHASTYRTSGSIGDRIARVPIDGSGRFGTMRIPTDPAATHTVQVQGPGFVAASLEFVTPNEGGQTELEIPVVRGADVPLRVVELVDGGGARPVADAYVSILWMSGLRWEKARAITNADGMATVGRLPLGQVSIDVRAEGFVQGEGQYVVTGDVMPFLEIPIERGATVRGHVLDGNDPVSDFTVYALDASSSNRRAQAFRGRKDGSFSLTLKSDRAWTLFAVTEARVQAHSVAIDPRIDTARTDVVLRVMSPRTVRGQVVDARTNEPVADAEVQAFSSHGGIALAPFGAVVLTRADGTFEGIGLAPGRGYVRVAHEAYAETLAACEVHTEGVNDFGVIALDSGASLAVRLRAPPGVDPTQVQCQLHGQGLVEPRNLALDGVARFERLAPGEWSVTLAFPEARFVQRTVRVRGTGEHQIEVDLSASHQVQVHVVAEPGVDLPADPKLMVRSAQRVDSAHSALSYVPLPSTHVATVDSMGFDKLQLVLLDAEWREIAGSPVVDLRSTERPVRFVVGRPSKGSNLVDHEGRPLQNVRCVLVELSSGWSAGVTTDAFGMLSMPEPPFERVSLVVMKGHAGYGILGGVPARPFPDEIRCDFGAELELLVRDRGTPIPGLTVYLEDGDRGELTVEFLPTDAAGNVRFGPLIAGVYTLSVASPSVWPARVHLEATIGGGARVLEVRRRGSAVIQVRRDGTAVGGLPIRVHSEEFQVDVHDWVAQARVGATPPSSVSDEHGALRFDGLPNGPYRWECSTEDGQTVSGRFSVLPLQRVDVEIRVP